MFKMYSVGTSSRYKNKNSHNIKISIHLFSNKLQKTKIKLTIDLKIISRIHYSFLS